MFDCSVCEDSFSAIDCELERIDSGRDTKGNKECRCSGPIDDRRKHPQIHGNEKATMGMLFATIPDANQTEATSYRHQQVL